MSQLPIIFYEGHSSVFIKNKLVNKTANDLYDKTTMVVPDNFHFITMHYDNKFTDANKTGYFLYFGLQWIDRNDIETLCNDINYLPIFKRKLVRGFLVYGRNFMKNKSNFLKQMKLYDKQYRANPQKQLEIYIQKKYNVRSQKLISKLKDYFNFTYFFYNTFMKEILDFIIKKSKDDDLGELRGKVFDGTDEETNKFLDDIFEKVYINIRIYRPKDRMNLMSQHSTLYYEPKPSSQLKKYSLYRHGFGYLEEVNSEPLFNISNINQKDNDAFLNNARYSLSKNFEGKNWKSDTYSIPTLPKNLKIEEINGDVNSSHFFLTIKSFYVTRQKYSNKKLLTKFKVYPNNSFIRITKYLKDNAMKRLNIKKETELNHDQIIISIILNYYETEYNVNLDIPYDSIWLYSFKYLLKYYKKFYEGNFFSEFNVNHNINGGIFILTGCGCYTDELKEAYESLPDAEKEKYKKLIKGKKPHLRASKSGQYVPPHLRNKQNYYYKYLKYKKKYLKLRKKIISTKHFVKSITDVGGKDMITKIFDKLGHDNLEGNILYRKRDNKVFIILGEYHDVGNPFIDDIIDIAKLYDIDIYIEGQWGVKTRWPETGWSEQYTKKSLPYLIYKLVKNDEKTNYKARIHRTDIRQLICSPDFYSTESVIIDSILYTIISRANNPTIEEYYEKKKFDIDWFILNSFIEPLRNMAITNKKLFLKQTNNMEFASDKDKYKDFFEKSLLEEIEQLNKNRKIFTREHIDQTLSDFLGSTDQKERQLILNNIGRLFMDTIHNYSFNIFVKFMDIYTIGRMLKKYSKIGIFYGGGKHQRDIIQILTSNFGFINIPVRELKILMGKLQ